MAIEMTAEEVQQEYVGAMGTELGNIFFELRNESILLHWKWEEFVTLFGTSSERVSLLNKSARAFFRIVQDSLWGDVLLHIARLTDPPRSAGKDNLTVGKLPELVAAPIREKIQTLLQECVAASAFARDWRNRRIAHSDLALALKEAGARPLAPASRKSVKETLSAFVKLLNAVQVHYLGSEAMYELRPLGNAEALLYVLQDGLKAEKDRFKRLKSGNYEPDDFGPREPI
jgi:hypothetical protein